MKPGRPRRYATESQVQQIIKLYDTNSMESISKLLNVSRIEVERIIKKN